ncbi:MAG: site-2 protease family protein [Treponemataceae bacterium]
MLVNILIGLLLLSILVFVHEAGHFIAARICGVDVIAFSIGFGPVLLKKTVGNTEYRLSLLPFGGYCSMRGEDAFSKAIEEKLDEIPQEKGGFYGVGKLRRAIIAFAGPFANYLMAILCFAIVAGIGTSYYTSSNEIAPVYYYQDIKDSPAEKAGLKMKDRIIKIDGEATNNFSEVFQKIALNAEKKMLFTIERDGKIIEKEITPALNKNTGAGYVGFYSYELLKIAELVKDSPFEKAGFMAGDLIVGINETKVANSQDLFYFFKNNPNLLKAEFTILRNGNEVKKNVDLPYYNEAKLPKLGLIIEGVKVNIEGKGFFGSLASGFIETHKTIAEVFKSLGLLFKGINFSSAIAGPLSISSMLGESAKAGFTESFLQGIFNIANFAAFICISLFIMNLLPIPILDGGIIFMALVEAIIRKPLHPKILYYIQIVGMFLIFVLAGFAIWADINRIFF